MSFEAINGSFQQLSIGNHAADTNLSEFRFADLPSELIAEIFLLTGESHSISKLSLVSKRMYVRMQTLYPERTAPDQVAAAINKIANLAKSKTQVCYLTLEEKRLLKEGSLLPVNAENAWSPRVSRIYHLYSSLENAARYLVAATPNSMDNFGDKIRERLGKDGNLFNFFSCILSGASKLKEANAKVPPDNAFKLYAAGCFIVAGKIDEASRIIQRLEPSPEMFVETIVNITRALVVANRSEDSILVSRLSLNPVFTPDRVQQLVQDAWISQEDYFALQRADSPDQPEDEMLGLFEPDDLCIDTPIAKNCDDMNAINWPQIN